jgi:hypothetical protein
MKAFPTTYRNYEESTSYDGAGMTLRDYFAAKAMQSMAIYSPPDKILKDTVKCAYEYADAMMEARK